MSHKKRIKLVFCKKVINYKKTLSTYSNLHEKKKFTLVLRNITVQFVLYIREMITADEYILISDLKAGSHRAFKIIYDGLYHPLFACAFRITRNELVSEDLLADAFIVLWQRKSEFDSVESIRRFLLIVVRNGCLSHLRKMKVAERAEQELLFTGGPYEQASSVENVREDLVQLAILAASELPEKMRAIFEMLYIDDLDFRETAKKLNISVKTVYAQHAHSISRIRQALLRIRAFIF